MNKPPTKQLRFCVQLSGGTDPRAVKTILEELAWPSDIMVDMETYKRLKSASVFICKVEPVIFEKIFKTALQENGAGKTLFWIPLTPIQLPDELKDKIKDIALDESR